MGDHDLVARHARHAASPFYEDIAARLAGGAGGSRTILAYHPVAQQHDTCVPASVATCASDLSGFVADYDRCAPALELDVLQPWERRLYAELRELASTTEPARLRPIAARLRRIWQDFGVGLDWRITLARAYVRHHVPWWQRLWIRV